MIEIEKNHIYKEENFQYKNFTLLSNEEKSMVLEWRNHENIRKWMYNTEPIKKIDHFHFIESLKERKDCFYWLVLDKKCPIGVVSLININYEKSEGESGFYLNPNDTIGEGFFFINAFYKLLFDHFGINRIYGGMLETNKFAIMHALFLGFKVDTEKILDNKKFLWGSLRKDDYYNDMDSKKNINNFVKFVKTN